MVIVKNVLFLYIILGSFLLTGCDFSQPIHKDIIQAQEYIRSGKYQRAIAVYENIVKTNPQKEIKMKMYYQLGELYSKNLINNSKALNYYRQVTKISENPLWLVKAEERISEISYSFIKNYHASVESYKNLKNFHPKLEFFDLYQYRLAKSYSFIGDTNNAIREYHLIQKEKKHQFHARAYFEEALIYFNNKDWKRAIKGLKEFLKFELKSEKIIEARFILANCYEMTEELKKAYNTYYSILGKYPNTKIINNRLQAIFKRRVARKR